MLAIGGLDPSGGAGITADARMLQLRGAHAATVATCLTDQDRRGFRGAVAVAPEWLERLLAAALGDAPVHAIKTGLFQDVRSIEVVAAALAPSLDAGVPLVVDPVLGATAGGWQPSGGVVAAYRTHLLPRARLVTPNLPELEVLAGGEAQHLLALGAAAVLVKGGHAAAAAGEPVIDRLVQRGGTVEFAHPRIATGPLHGTGCALASAIAARLAHGDALETACREAVDVLDRCIRASRHAGVLPEPLQLV